MSIRAYVWGWKQKISPTQKLVLLALCNHHNAERGDDDVWPDQETIAMQTGFTPRAVNSALKALEAKGLIKRQRRMIRGQRTCDLITILVDRAQAVSPARNTFNPSSSSAPLPEANSGSNQKETPETTGTTFTVISKDEPVRLKRINPAAFFPEFFEPNRPDLDAWNYAGRTIVEISIQLGTAIDWASPGIQDLLPVVEWLRRLEDHKVTSCLIEVAE
jgi:DNA-binding MarR family transcriptional regulator